MTTQPAEDCAEAVSYQVNCDPAYLSKHTATPDDMPSDNETLDISFSQKIPVRSHNGCTPRCEHLPLPQREIREETVAVLRKALWKGLQKTKVDDKLRQRMKTVRLDDSRRSVALTC